LKKFCRLHIKPVGRRVWGRNQVTIQGLKFSHCPRKSVKIAGTILYSADALPDVKQQCPSTEGNTYC